MRKFPRYEVSATVDVTGGNNDVLLFHKIQNISLGGICIQTPTIEEVGTIVDLVITLPSQETIELKGEVVWVNREPPMDMGIRYLELDDAKRERLKQLWNRMK